MSTSLEIIIDAINKQRNNYKQETNKKRKKKKEG